MCTYHVVITIQLFDHTTEASVAMKYFCGFSAFRYKFKKISFVCVKQALPSARRLLGASASHEEMFNTTIQELRSDTVTPVLQEVCLLHQLAAGRGQMIEALM